MEEEIERGKVRARHKVKEREKKTRLNERGREAKNVGRSVYIVCWFIHKLLKSIEKFWPVSNTISSLKKLKLFNRLFSVSNEAKLMVKYCCCD